MKKTTSSEGGDALGFELSRLPDKIFNEITLLASSICRAPISLVSFRASNREFFKSAQGFSVREIPLDHSICSHFIRDRHSISVLPDVRNDNRFKGSRLAKGRTPWIFVASASMRNSEGVGIGTLSVVDHRKRTLNKDQVKALGLLAKQAEKLLQLYVNQPRPKTEDPGAARSPRKKNVMRERRIAEEQLNTITDNIPGVVFRYRLFPGGSDELQHVSAGAVRLWGITASAAMRDNQLVWDRYDKRDLQAHLKSINLSAENGNFWQHEWRYRHPDGSVRWHKGSGNPIRAGDGSTVWDSVILDITELKTAEAEVAHIMERLRERVKEQACLYRVANLANADYPVDELLKRVVEILPQGWQFPDITTAEISFGKIRSKTPHHKKTRWIQTVSKTTMEGEMLSITIAYQKKQPVADEGPFLREERQLLEGVATNLVLGIERYLSARIRNLLLQSTEEGIYGIDNFGNCTFINPAASRMTGHSVEDCLGKNMHKLIHHKRENGKIFQEKDCPIFKARDLRDGIRVDEDFFWRADGSLFPVRYSSTPIIENGEVAGAVIVFNDITVQKRQKLENQKYEARFRTLIENGADSVAIIGHDGQPTYVSPSIRNVLGYTEKEALRLNLLEVVHPEDRAHVALRMKEVMKYPGKPIPGYTSRVLHKNGSWRWLESTITNMLHDPAINGIVDNFRDVTERLTAASQLQESVKRYDLVNKATNDAIYDWHVEEDIVQWGDAFGRIFGHDTRKSKFRRKQWEGLIHSSNRRHFEDDWDAFLSDPQRMRWNKEYKLRKADLQYIWVEEIGYLLRDARGKPQRMIGVLRDISESKHNKLQQEIRQKVASFFIAEKSLSATLVDILEYLRNFGRFQMAELWLKGHHDASLHRVARHASGKVAEMFYSSTDKTTRLSMGEGLPGRVWEKLASEIGEQVDDPEGVGGVSAQAGQKSVAGVPLLSNDIFVGVLVFGLMDSEGISHERLLPFTALSNFLGAEIIRKRQEEEMRLLFENAPEIIAIAAPDGRFLKVNPAFCKITGYTEEELMSNTYENFVHDEDLSRSRLEFSETISGKRQAVNYVNRWRTRSGDYRWISWNSSPVFNEEGLVFSFGRDVTELIRLQGLLNTATQLARVGGWELDPIKKSVYFSDISREIHEVDGGYSFDLNAAIDFYREEDRAFVRTTVQEGLTNGTPWDFELPLITAKGNERWIRSIGRAEFHDGVCVKLHGSLQDIHHRKIAELRLKSISDNIPGLLFQYHMHPDGSGELESVSAASREIWGFTPEECVADIEKVWRGFNAGGDIERLMESIRESKDNLTRWHNRARYVTPDQRIRYHEIFGNPHKRPNGTIVWDCVLLDITDKFELEELAKRTSMMARIGSWELDLSQEIRDTMYFSPMTREILEVGDNYNPSLSGGFEFYEPESKQRIMQAVDALINSDIKFDEELLITTAKGNQRWIRCIGERDEVEGRCVRIYGSFQDIHKQKTAELELEQAFEERNRILESIGDAFFALDLDWKVLYWNTTAENLMGMPRNEILGRSLWEKFPAARELKFYTEYARSLAAQTPVHFEEFYRPANIWLEVNAYPSREGISVFFRDITEEKAAKAQLQESNERFEKIAEATSDAIWDYNFVEDRLFWGRGFQKQFGHDLETITPSFPMLVSMIHPEDRDRVATRINSFMRDPELFQWFDEYRFLRADGTYAFVIDRAVFIRNTQGQPVRAVGAMTDITYRKEYEDSLKNLNEKLEIRARELAVSNAELEQFAYVASHDLQEPLRMVSSFLTQLERKYRDRLDEKATQYIHFAVDGAQRMRQIILDLLEFSRIGKHRDDLQKVSLKSIVNEVSLLLQREIDEKNVRIVTEDLPLVRSYRTPLLHIFQNLMSNSIKYSDARRSPVIRITSRKSEGGWEIAVADNGIGIEEAYYEKVFVIFQRLHGTEYTGTGMGLALVKKNIESLGGRIWISSTPGKGSTFYFTIPDESLPESSSPVD